MRITLFLSILLALCFRSAAQHSPIKWLNNRWNVNIDTSGNNRLKTYHFRDSPVLVFRFLNVGEHVTFIDSASGFSDNALAKPGEVKTVYVKELLNRCWQSYAKRRDTSISVSIPFYYEGRVYMERVFLDLTFGKSKLIQYEYRKTDLTDTIAAMVQRRPDLSLRYNHYISIRNRTSGQIWCTPSLITYNDTQELRPQLTDYKSVGARGKFELPAQLYMDKKYNFRRPGYFEVFNESVYEVHPVEVISSFVRTPDATGK